MNDMRLNRISGLARGEATERQLRLETAEARSVRPHPGQAGDGPRSAWRCRTPPPAALDAAPDSAEVRTLMGLLHQRVGEHHAAYQCYRLALLLDRHDPVAGDGLRRYCRRFGFDPGNRAINPGLATT